MMQINAFQTKDRSYLVQELLYNQFVDVAIVYVESHGYTVHIVSTVNCYHVTLCCHVNIGYNSYDS